MKQNRTTATKAWNSFVVNFIVPEAQHINSWTTVRLKLLGCYVYGEWRDDISPDVFLNILSGILVTLDNASLGQRFPWTMRPLDDTSLNYVPWPFGIG